MKLTKIMILDLESWPLRKNLKDKEMHLVHNYVNICSQLANSKNQYGPTLQKFNKSSV